MTNGELMKKALWCTAKAIKNRGQCAEEQTSMPN
jgi:hypothetical protein